MDSTVKNIVETAIEAGQEMVREPIASPLKDGVPFMVLRDSNGTERIEFLHNVFERPKRKTGVVKLHDQASFLAFWKKHAIESSAVYASLRPAQFVAVLDDHKTDAPDYRQHRALYAVTHSREWTTWAKADRQPFAGNEAFALFIQDQVPDIVKPDGAKMLEIALNFRATSNAAFGNAVRLTDGNTEFTYTNATDASSRSGTTKVRIPEEFEISIPVFEGLDARKYKISARFRHRLQGGALHIWYELVRPHKVEEQSFSDMFDAIRKETKSVLFGTPE